MATSARVTVAEQKELDRKIKELHERLDRVERVMEEQIARVKEYAEEKAGS